jgi:hypothetical protein
VDDLYRQGHKKIGHVIPIMVPFLEILSHTSDNISKTNEHIFVASKGISRLIQGFGRAMMIEVPLANLTCDMLLQP